MDLRRIIPFALPVSICFLIQPAVADDYPIILHGKVLMDDGSPPPVIVSVERICSDSYGSMPGVLTDKKGEFIWRMNIDPLESRNCVIRASHTGYTSTEVEVSGIDTIHTTYTLPNIVIRSAAPDPDVLNFSDNGIAPKARAEWKAAIKALDAQNLAEGAPHLEAVVAAAPKAQQAWHALGVVDDRLGKTAEARAAFEHAIEVDAKLLPPYVLLTRVCIKTKDWNCAAKTADTLIKADVKHSYFEVYLHQAVALYELKDLAKAQASVEEAIRLDKGKKLPRAEYVLGRILEARGDVAGAKEHMAKYLQLEPAPPDVDLVRGHIDSLGKEANGVDPDLEVL
jgi:tetratricopeptide (TPR) repeat protein